MSTRNGLDPDVAARLDRALAGLRALPSVDEFRPAAVDAIRDARLHLLVLPAAMGGLGAGLRTACEVLAAIAAEDASTALGLAMQTHVIGTAVESGAWPAAPFERLLRDVRDHGALINAASSEEGTGSPSRGGLPDTRAVRTADGFRVTGEKTFTTWLPALRYALVSARLVGDDGAPDSGPDGSDAGASAVIGNLLVDLASPGVGREAGFDALGMRGSASGRLRLQDVLVPSDLLVIARLPNEPDPRGASGPGWFGMVLAATYLGVGEGARAAVTRWAIDRRPGDGSTAVADLPTVQLRLGRLDATLRVARIVTMDTATCWDAAASSDRPAILPDVSLAKLTATNAAVSATDEALRIAGGPGFVVGPLERAFRDARAGLINPPLDDVALGGFGKSLVERERSSRRS